MTMKPEDVAIKPANTGSAEGSEHDLWIGGEDRVLTITLNKRSRAFPPNTDHSVYFNKMIQGLARAAKDVIFRAENDVKTNTEFAVQPIDDIVNAIIMISQLSEAVQSEANS